VRYAASGTQVDKTVQTRDSNCNFNAVSAETEKSDEVLAEQVQKGPRTGPNGNASGAKSGYVHGRLVGIGESTSLCSSFRVFCVSFPLGSIETTRQRLSRVRISWHYPLRQYPSQPSRSSQDKYPEAFGQLTSRVGCGIADSMFRNVHHVHLVHHSFEPIE
jgi:hypothetical protein